MKNTLSYSFCLFWILLPSYIYVYVHVHACAHSRTHTHIHTHFDSHLPRTYCVASVENTWVRGSNLVSSSGSSREDRDVKRQYRSYRNLEDRYTGKGGRKMLRS